MIKDRRYSPYPDRNRRGDSHKQDQGNFNGENGRWSGVCDKIRVRERRF